MKQTFVLKNNWIEIFNILSDKQAGILIKMLFDYNVNGEITEGMNDEIVKAYFNLMRLECKSLKDNYDRRCETSALNGLKGGAKQGNQNAKKQPKNNLKQPKNNLNNLKQPNKNLGCLEKKDTPLLDNIHYPPEKKDFLKIEIDKSISKKSENLNFEISKFSTNEILEKEKSCEKKENETEVLNAYDMLCFENVWRLYEKKGNRKTSEKKWANLKNHCREAALLHIPLYVQSTPDKQFRKNFETYLNQEAWNDEIIKPTNYANTTRINGTGIDENFVQRITAAATSAKKRYGYE